VRDVSFDVLQEGEICALLGTWAVANRLCFGSFTARFASHDEMMRAKGFCDLEKEIMHRMRDEMRHDTESLALP